MSFDNLNAKIQKVEIGIRKPYVVTLYPMSVGDELAFVEMLRGSFDRLNFVGTEAEFIDSLFGVVQERIRELLFFVIDKEEWQKQNPDVENPDLLKHVTNEQAVEIIEKIYQMNFEQISKKLKGVMAKLNLNPANLTKNLRQKSDLSRGSFDITPNTDFETSLPDDSKTGDSQNVN